MVLNSNWDNIYDADSKTLNLTQRDLRTLPADIIGNFAACTEHIDLSHNRLSNLSWISEFVVLKEVILDNNRLCEAHLKRLSQPLDNVTILMLNKNEFGDLHETIEQISRLFPNLEHLGLHGNAICPDGLGLRPFSDYVGYDNAFYRSYILNALPNLKFLDHYSTKPAEFPDIISSKNWMPTWKKPTLIWNKLNGYIKCLYQNIIMTFDRKCNENSRFENSIIANQEL